jgi:hypothetical protein
LLQGLYVCCAMAGSCREMLLFAAGDPIAGPCRPLSAGLRTNFVYLWISPRFDFAKCAREGRGSAFPLPFLALLVPLKPYIADLGISEAS